MGKININGVNLELDLMDINIMGKYEQLMHETVERVQDKSQYEGKSNAEGMKYQCNLVENLFDKLFGEGTAEKIFSGKENNIYAHLEAFATIAKEGAAAGQKISTLVAPFLSSPNREQRRAADKKKKKKKAKGKKK